MPDAIADPAGNIVKARVSPEGTGDRGPYVGGQRDGGEQPFRVGRVTVEDEDARRRAGHGRMGSSRTSIPVRPPEPGCWQHLPGPLAQSQIVRPARLAFPQFLQFKHAV